MNKIKSFLMITVMALTISHSTFAAEPCVVESQSDSATNSSTLRYVVEEFLNDRSDKPCSATGYEDGEYFAQSVGFLTPEANAGSTPDVETIVLTDRIRFNMNHTAVIGNISQDAVDDTRDDESEVNYNDASDASVEDITYDADGNKSNDGDAYTKAGGNIKDYGMVVLDARSLGEDVKPFTCSNDSEAVYFRNVIILTDKVSFDEVFTNCIKDGGNAWVCQNEYQDGVDPRSGDTWCKSSFTLTPFPFPLEFHTYYLDADGDGFGDPNRKWIGVRPPFWGNYVTNDDDCNDADPAINPDAEEICDEIDNDCDALIDEGLSDCEEESTWYHDNDGDGYGDPSDNTTSVDQPEDYVADNTDCNDNNTDINPAAIEECDGIDNNCNGDVDEGLSDCSEHTWYGDDDGDGYGDPTDPQTGYDQPEGTVDNNGDCNDDDISINPGAEEICDEIDNDCDGEIDENEDCIEWDWYGDDDGDGYGDSDDHVSDNEQPDGYVANDDDCNDSDNAINPSVAEICDEIDNDCDGEIDEGLTDCESAVWFRDADADGYGTPLDYVYALLQPEGYVGNALDCNDNDYTLTLDCSPDKWNEENDECADGIDNDANGAIDCEDALCIEAAACAPADEGTGSDPLAECTDGVDNDNDGLTDCDDSPCSNFDVCITPSINEGQGDDPVTECSDGIDNDNDGLTDCRDSTCALFAICEIEPEPQITPDPVDPDFGGNLSGSAIAGGCSLNSNDASEKELIMLSIILCLILTPLYAIAYFRERNNDGFGGIHLIAFTILALTQASNASAALQSRFDAMNFTPASDGGNYFTVWGAESLGQWQGNVGFTLDYARSPLKFTGVPPGSREGVIDYMVTGNAYGMIGVTDWFSIGINVPVAFYNAYFADVPTNAPTGLADGGAMPGDLQFSTKFRLLDIKEHGVGVAIIPYITAPTGDENRYAGNGAATGGGIIAAEFEAGDRVTVAVNAGYRVRDNVVRHGVEMDDELTYGAGLNVDITKDESWQAIVEAQGGTVVKNAFKNSSSSPLEADVGIRHQFADSGFALTAGGGVGLVSGVGNPVARGFVGVNWKGKKPAERIVKVVDTRIVGNKIIVAWGKIFFDTNKTTIKPISFPVLDEIVDVMQKNPQIKLVEVQGHTDARASDAYNLKLSSGRAAAAMQYLISKGVAASRLRSQGYGESKPIAHNNDESGWSQNRRTEFVIIQQDQQ